MKKTGLIMLLAALTGCFTACGSGGSADKDVYEIGICQLEEHSALNEATRGFEEALTNKLGDRVSFDYQTAEGSADNCKTILKGFVSDQKDLIMANATPALKAANQATSMIPIVAASITDYGTALEMEDWSGASGINITGTSDLAPIESQADMIFELVPDAEKVGILYCSNETNSIFQVQQMETMLNSKKVIFESYTTESADADEVEAAVKAAAAECDVIYIPTDNAMAANVSVIKDVLMSEKIPMIAGEEGICEAGIATLSIDYYSIGYTAGEMAYEVLEEGKDPGEMDVRYADEFTKKYNKENCKVLGIEVPEDYEPIS